MPDTGGESMPVSSNDYAHDTRRKDMTTKILYALNNSRSYLTHFSSGKENINSGYELTSRSSNECLSDPS